MENGEPDGKQGYLCKTILNFHLIKVLSFITSDSIRQNILHFGDIFIATLLTIKYFIIMANCDFAGGVENVRGTICKSTRINWHGERVTTRVVAMMRGGKQRVYIRQDRERSTPISDNERQARARFKEFSQMYTSMSDETKRKYEKEWKRANYKFNGKKYVTLRGYIMARHYAEHPQGGSK